MAFSDTPLLGNVRLSGCTQVIIRSTDYTLEHKMPGMEGGIVEREGRSLTRIELHGFLWSGADDQYFALASGVSSGQMLTIPSTLSGFAFFSGAVYIESVKFFSKPGKRYSYYNYRIVCVASGEYQFPQWSGGMTYANAVEQINAQFYGVDLIQSLSGNFNSGGSGYAQ